MVHVEYTQADYNNLLCHLGKQLGGKIVGNVLTLPHTLASGTITYYQLPRGLDLLVSDYVVQQDMLIKRNKIDKDLFALRFDEMHMPGDEGLQKAAVFLTNTRYEWMFLSNAGTIVKSVSIRISPEWLRQYLQLDNAEEEVFRYLSLKVSSFYFEPMDSGYKELLQDIFVANSNDGFKDMIIQNRTLMLLERFFTRIYMKSTDATFNTRLSNDDIARLKKVEALLTRDFSMQVPSLDALAKAAAMSTSKLKTCFKELYGMPVYGYYQKLRMQKAKAMLLSGKYTLRQVSEEVGYYSLNNFSKAFEKIFEQHPAELLR